MVSLMFILIRTVEKQSALRSSAKNHKHVAFGTASRCETVSQQSLIEERVGESSLIDGST